MRKRDIMFVYYSYEHLYSAQKVWYHVVRTKCHLTCALHKSFGHVTTHYYYNTAAAAGSRMFTLYIYCPHHTLESSDRDKQRVGGHKKRHRARFMSVSVSAAHIPREHKVWPYFTSARFDTTTLLFCGRSYTI